MRKRLSQKMLRRVCRVALAQRLSSQNNTSLAGGMRMQRRMSGLVPVFAMSLLSVSGMSPAWADVPHLDEQVSFDIKAQTFEAALLQLAKQSQLQLAIAANALPAGNAPRVSGKMPIKQAIDLLLQNTQLGYASARSRSCRAGLQLRHPIASPVVAMRADQCGIASEWPRRRRAPHRPHPLSRRMPVSIRSPWKRSSSREVGSTIAHR
jgi:hypothetical protein